MKRKLIITADDYGMCDAVNEAIEDCLAAGLVRATCAMVNMQRFTATEFLRRRFPGRSIGIHWTLTQGRPVLPPSRVSSLVSPNGEFYSNSQFRHRWLFGRIDATEIKDELRAQVQRFRQVAGRPDFWNTHQNVHVLPRLFQLCVAAGQELGIPAMRSHRRLTVPRNTSALRHNLLHPAYWLKGSVVAYWVAQAEARGVLMPDGRIYMPGYDGDGIASLEEILGRIEWGAVSKAVELVVHPATTIQDSLFGSLTHSRVLEYNVLRESRLLERLSQKYVEVVGFEALRASG
jgi:chitin disaccharide deacetylase